MPSNEDLKGIIEGLRKEKFADIPTTLVASILEIELNSTGEQARSEALKKISKIVDEYLEEVE